jgi:hypothetical protein
MPTTMAATPEEIITMVMGSTMMTTTMIATTMIETMITLTMIKQWQKWGQG